MTYCKHCSIDSATVAAQARMLEAKEMEIAELKEVLHRETKAVYPGFMKLTPGEAMMLSLMLTREIVSRQELYTAYLNTFPDRTPDPKIIDVMVCKVRHKIAPLNLTIDTVYGRGYRIPRQEAKEMLHMLEAA